jgi:hypothetical protein
VTRHLLCLALLGCIAFPPTVARAQKQQDISFKIIETFAKPGSLDTYAQAISNNGLVSGFYFQDGVYTGFIHPIHGKNIAGIVFVPNPLTFLPGINSSGLAVGYGQDGYGQYGFFYQDGTITPYNIAGADYTALLGINDAGDFTGYYAPPFSLLVAFASLGGTITNFGVPGAYFTIPQAINTQREIVGWYQLTGDTDIHGFIRHPNGKLIYPVDFPGSNQTQLYGVNDHGVVVGTFFDANGLFHGLVIQSDGQITQIDVPGASGNTAVQGINNERKICGYYYTGRTETSFTAQLMR